MAGDLTAAGGAAGGPADEAAANAALRERFVRDVLANRYNRAILERFDTLGLPDSWLVAGCLFQSAWNAHSGAAPEARIKDYDLFYFDAADLSRAAETRVQARVDACFADLGIAIEAANQARVHLWYPAFFGLPYPRLHGSCDGIDRFLICSTCVGMRPAAESMQGFEIYAPHGLRDLYRGVLAPNPLRDAPALFREKAESYRSRWPWLVVGADGGA